jgi:hypothetical protein
LHKSTPDGDLCLSLGIRNAKTRLPNDAIVRTEADAERYREGSYQLLRLCVLLPKPIPPPRPIYLKATVLLAPAVVRSLLELNGYCESFNSKLRDQFLNGNLLIEELHVLAENSRVH